MNTPVSVLFIEDNPGDARLVREQLSLNGQASATRLIWVDQLASGLEYLPGGQVDAVLLDLSLPDSHGLDTLQRVLEAAPGIPVIVMTGTTDENLALQAVQAGAQDYLIKGQVDGGLLTRAIRYAMERKRLELQMRELAAIVEHSEDVIFRKDLDGTIRSWNRGAEQLYGYRPEEVIGRPVSILIPPEHLDRMDQIMSRIRRGEKVQYIETDRIRKDGGHVTVSLKISPIRDGRDNIIAASVLARDITEKKRADEAVQQMRDRFQALTEHAPDGVALIDMHQRMQFVSPAGRRMFGYSQQEHIEINPADHTHPEDLPEVISALSRLIEDPGYTPTLQYRFRHKDGSWRWIESTFTNLLEVKSVEAIVINFRDITERKQDVKLLLEQKALLDKSQEIAHVGSWELDLALDRLIWSDEVYRIFGLHPQEFDATYQAFLEAVHPDDREAVEIAYSGSLQAGAEGYQLEHRIIRRDTAEVRTVLEKCEHLRDGMGRIIRSVGIVQDITGRIQDEQRIRQQLRRLNILRKIDQGITGSAGMGAVLDIILRDGLNELGADAGVVLLYDPEEQLLKYERGIGMRTTALQHTQLKPGEGYAGRAALSRQTVMISSLLKHNTEFLDSPSFSQEGFACYFGVPLIVKDEIKGVLEIFHRAPLQPGQEWLDFMETLAGQTAIAIDHAQLWQRIQRQNLELEQRVAERTAELEHANRAKDEFLATMSHELRTPLNSILGLSESLLEQRRDPLSERQQASLHIVESSGRHLLDLINDILDLSKIEAGKLDYYPQVVDVHTLCRASLAFVKEQAVRKSISMVYAETNDGLRIHADPRRLKQALVNLLTNAVKFTPEHGQVTLEIYPEPEEDRVRFSVTDTGIGITEKDLKQLFQPFVQVDSSLNRHYEGTGLGLVLVERLTDLHGGSVHVQSEPGRGSRFTISIPWRQEEVTRQEIIEAGGALPARAAPPNGVVPSRDVTVLLAEDNAANTLMISEYLESRGYQMVNAYDGLDAIEKAEAAGPHIILMDIQMPAMDGLEAIRRLRDNPRFSCTPIVALTALAMTGDRERCIQAGADEYMSKPVSLRMLAETIERMLQAGL